VRAGGAPRKRGSTRRPGSPGTLAPTSRSSPIDRQVLPAKLGGVLIDDWEKYRTRWIDAGAPFTRDRSGLPALGGPNQVSSCATKAGMASIARTPSGELIGRGIRVNSVSPGPSRRRCMTARPKTSADSSWPRSRQAVWAVRARLRSGGLPHLGRIGVHCRRRDRH
jgi:NAD(P)-dependent dehydrogenase (short-subunit alcohol dehydrogenase family)